jgi:hypothetical protein
LPKIVPDNIMKLSNPKIGREIICYGIDACICCHSESAHQDKCTGVIGPSLDRNCKCKSYRPKDNLVFLEHKYGESEQHGRENKD